VEFVRQKGVVGLAVGFILGGAVSKVVAALVNDILNPLLGLLLGAIGNWRESYISIGSANILWGDFLATLIDFLVVALVVYYGVTWLRLDKLEKQPEEKKEEKKKG